MNKKLFAFLLSVVVLLFGASLNTWAQGKAKKPRVVVVPSDRLLNTMGLLSTTDDMGQLHGWLTTRKLSWTMTFKLLCRSLTR